MLLRLLLKIELFVFSLLLPLILGLLGLICLLLFWLLLGWLLLVDCHVLEHEGWLFLLSVGPLVGRLLWLLNLLALVDDLEAGLAMVDPLLRDDFLLDFLLAEGGDGALLVSWVHDLLGLCFELRNWPGFNVVAQVASILAVLAGAGVAVAELEAAVLLVVNILWLGANSGITCIP